MSSDTIVILLAIALLLDLWSVTAIVSSAETKSVKALWSLAVIGLPFVGFLAWLYKGPGPSPAL